MGKITGNGTIQGSLVSACLSSGYDLFKHVITSFVGSRIIEIIEANSRKNKISISDKAGLLKTPAGTI
jgi:hypothetical protein